MNFLNKKTAKERGQAIMLVAIALVGLLAMLGLMIDVGRLFIESSRMKRAIDSAAVAASLEFREGVDLTLKEDTPNLLHAAQEFILLNEPNTILLDETGPESEDGIHTYICDTTKVASEPEHYAGLCPDPTPSDPNDDYLYADGDFLRKLVRVRGTKRIVFNFLTVVGIDGTTVTTDAIGEAASVDVVLVIDASTSMADLTDPANGGKDFTVCNTTNPKTCEPFETIKGYAKDFADQLLYPYDRISVISFDRLAHNATVGGEGWEYNATQIKTTIDSLMVYRNDLPDCSVVRPGAGLCADYDPISGNFLGKTCPHVQDTGDAASCSSSNIGGGIELANYQFTRDIREEALWVIILLASGPANAISPTGAHPAGYCPPGTSDPTPIFPGFQQPICRDDQAGEDDRHISTEANYDGDDFARDMADATVADGQGAVIYTIGYGGDGVLADNKITNDTRHRNEPYDPDIAEQLLIYIATKAGTVDNLGLYISAPTNAELVAAFKKIAENIATKISQ